MRKGFHVRSPGRIASLGSSGFYNKPRNDENDGIRDNPPLQEGGSGVPVLAGSSHARCKKQRHVEPWYR
ncbi:hypothetical protein FRC19_007572 [Serendipita sp. 401]|nr:hypothetical protein FRC19_007572 [Serendipita sp. 401]